MSSLIFILVNWLSRFGIAIHPDIGILIIIVFIKLVFFYPVVFLFLNEALIYQLYTILSFVILLFCMTISMFYVAFINYLLLRLFNIFKRLHLFSFWFLNVLFILLLNYICIFTFYIDAGDCSAVAPLIQRLYIVYTLCISAWFVCLLFWFFIIYGFLNRAFIHLIWKQLYCILNFINALLEPSSFLFLNISWLNPLFDETYKQAAHRREAIELADRHVAKEQAAHEQGLSEKKRVLAFIDKHRYIVGFSCFAILMYFIFKQLPPPPPPPPPSGIDFVDAWWHPEVTEVILDVVQQRGLSNITTDTFVEIVIDDSEEVPVSQSGEPVVIDINDLPDVEAPIIHNYSNKQYIIDPMDPCN